MEQLLDHNLLVLILHALDNDIGGLDVNLVQFLLDGQHLDLISQSKMKKFY